MLLFIFLKNLALLLQIQNEQILCLLYHEAKYNVIEGRYILHEEDYHYLAGIQALIHLGSFDSHQHVIANYRWVKVCCIDNMKMEKISFTLSLSFFREPHLLFSHYL